MLCFGYNPTTFVKGSLKAFTVNYVSKMYFLNHYNIVDHASIDYKSPRNYDAKLKNFLTLYRLRETRVCVNYVWKEYFEVTDLSKPLNSPSN